MSALCERIRRAVVCTTVILVFAPAVWSRVIEVTGRVTDELGIAVPGIPVGSRWSFESGDHSHWKPIAMVEATVSAWEEPAPIPRAVITDEHGVFALQLGVPDDTSIAVMAIDAERRRGAIAEFSPDRRGEPLILRLRPLADVEARFVSSESNDSVPVAWALYPDGNRLRVADGYEESGRIQLPLPPGRYYFAVESEGLNVAAFRFKIGKRALEPRTIALEPTLLARLNGEAAPEIHATSATGFPDGVVLADLRGKWILICFWAHWCGPCIRGMPDLLSFWDDHVDLHERFEILAFHDGTVASLPELDAKLVAVAHEFWEGRALPFPVLIDPSETTLRRYGINSFPTMVLIDPQGHIVASKVGDGSRLLEQLSEALQGE